MYAWQATVQDEAGNIVPLPVVTVYNKDVTTLANIYNEAGAPLPNPMTGTMEGFVQFWAAAGKYKVRGASGAMASEVWEVFLSSGMTSFATRGDFLAARAAGEFDDLAEGAAISVDGELYVKRTGATTIPQLPGWDYPRSVHKSILTGDWQPRIAYPAEIQAFKDMLDDVQANHGDADDVCHVGDIVDRASEGQTGNVNAVFGFQPMLQELWSRTAIPRTYFITGNHDSDGLGAGTHQWARSHRQYLDYIGRRFYYVRMGNLLRVFMGTMTADAGGNIHTTTLYWFDQVLKRNQGCNVEVYIHQPLYGYNGYAEDSDAVQYKAVSDRIVASLQAVDNVAFVCSGHIARPEDLPNYYDAYGTRMFGVNMHIPRVTTVGAGSTLPYGVIEYARGSKAATVRFWDATTHGWISGRNIPITYKYPLDLGDGVPDFDGRYALQENSPSVDGILQVQRSTWEDRVNEGTPDSPNWVTVQGFRPGVRLVLMETTPDDAKAGDGMSIDWWVPASAAVANAESTHTEITGNYLAGRLGVRKQFGTETDTTGQYAVQLGQTGVVGSLRDVMTINGDDGSANLPLSRLGGDALPALGLLAGLGLDNSLLDKGRIPSGANFNSYTESGIFRVQHGGDAATMTNIPFNNSGGVLLVLNPAATASVRPVAASGQIQVYFAVHIAAGGSMYFRACNSGTWMPWRAVTSTVV